ncbi:hypothetical protein BG842_02840 [Haladaptatus sp. W1]|uniref:DUF6610 family protein n=1 Tax=Haladaptatus sp. W1 TaxID=1897478 RepID=UPI000849B69F|nr:DUF6610 family protein [Haladaptatus sp. W1]ODR80188.1 hypothetical protein BG842_02840 [Haladaptatus sp. W1]
MSIHDLSATTSDSATKTYADARQAKYVAFLHRVPFALDALHLGFLPGFREDCTYQQSQFNALECPVGMLDNDFRNPDLDRYIERVFEYEPAVGVIGDAYDATEARTYVDTIRELETNFPDTEFIIVPKCRAAIDVIPDDIVLGYSRGYADKLAHEFSDPIDWRGRRVHILGGSPPKQLAVIDQLTQPTLSGDPPADIVGMDWNGLHRGAQFGEFWTGDGWDDSGRNADHVTIRKTVRHSLSRVRDFWQAHGIWPESTLQADGFGLEYHGPTPDDLENSACTECGTNVWTTERGPFVAEYDTGVICGYCSYDCYFTHRHQNQLEEVAGDQSVYFPPG